MFICIVHSAIIFLHEVCRLLMICSILLSCVHQSVMLCSADLSPIQLHQWHIGKEIECITKYYLSSPENPLVSLILNITNLKIADVYQGRELDAASDSQFLAAVWVTMTKLPICVITLWRIRWWFVCKLANRVIWRQQMHWIGVTKLGMETSQNSVASL